ncbi:hypothetical protein [Bacillus stercoris]|uniref:hypothetical protein n=1 Tax=Bacillus stercoris TaxID=2054641 RepID=UPI002ACABAB6|nr:hypothetical protein [Bacillus stercoris]MDZ5671910.1 hypothetical protein [Bacillus stercoris]
MSYSEWATDNYQGRQLGPVFVPEGKEILGVKVKEQAGAGIIDIKFRFRNQDDEIQETGWITNNDNETEEREIDFRGETMVGLELKEQAGYGIVDIRAILNGDKPLSEWATNNPAQVTIKETIIDKNSRVNGFEVMEQAGYGIVNLRLTYTDE